MKNEQKEFLNQLGPEEMSFRDRKVAARTSNLEEVEPQKVCRDGGTPSEGTDNGELETENATANQLIPP